MEMIKDERIVSTKTDAEKFKMIEFLSNYLPVISSKIPTIINEGGCGIFTKHLYLNLKKLGFDVNICFIAENQSKKDLVYLSKNNKINGNRLGILHSMVKFSEYIFLDSDGLTKNPTDIEYISNGKDYYGEMSIESLSVLNNNVDSWNTMFDRKCEKQIIKELGKIGEQFELFMIGKCEFKPKLKTRLSEHTISVRKDRQSSIFNILGSKSKKRDEDNSIGKLVAKIALLSHMKNSVEKIKKQQATSDKIITKNK